jgi:ATP-dependent 26S proteasome regulatory subunit
MSSQFINYVCAAYPLLLVRTYEEYRVLSQFVAQLKGTKILDENGQESGEYKAFVWDVVDGVRPLETGSKAIEGTAFNPNAALDFLAKAEDNTLLFVKDFHPFFEKEFQDRAIIIRKVRNLSAQFKAKGKTLVFISPDMKPPMELEKEVTIVDYKLPERAELQVVLKSVCKATGAAMPKDKEVEALLDAALGMTALEAENAFAVSLVEAKKFDAALIRREKAAIVKKTGLLEVIETTETLDQIGGLENAKEWALLKKDSFTPEAKAFGIISPKGVLLNGVPGCGKSLLSKVLSVVFGRPLFRLDMSKIKSKWVGESESNFRMVLDTVGATAPSILWIDEIEKVLSGNGNGQDGHEVMKGIFGMFLTWMEEKKEDVILVATVNNIGNLPPELMSRFDVTFWVDLPDAVQRLEIVKIHVKKALNRSNWGKNLKAEDLFTEAQLTEIVKATEHFSGREIEAVVKDGMSRAWANRHAKLQADDLVAAAKSVTPTAVVKKQELTILRNKAMEQGMKNASISHEQATVTEGPGSRKVNTGINLSGAVG